MKTLKSTSVPFILKLLGNDTTIINHYLITKRYKSNQNINVMYKKFRLEKCQVTAIVVIYRVALIFCKKSLYIKVITYLTTCFIANLRKNREEYLQHKYNIRFVHKIMICILDIHVIYFIDKILWLVNKRCFVITVNIKSTIV